MKANYQTKYPPRGLQQVLVREPGQKSSLGFSTIYFREHYCLKLCAHTLFDFSLVDARFDFERTRCSDFVRIPTPILDFHYPPSSSDNTAASLKDYRNVTATRFKIEMESEINKQTGQRLKEQTVQPAPTMTNSRFACH